MSLVWDRFTAGGSEKLTLLALADWANDHGESLHPSMQAIADKVNVSRSQAQRIMHGLIEDGWLHVVGNDQGGAPGCTRQYRIDVEKLKTGRMDAAPDAHEKKAKAGRTDDTRTGRTDATGSADATGRMDAQRRAAPMHRTGRMGAQDGSHPCDTNHHISTIEPPVEPPVPVEAKKPAPTAATWTAYSEAYQRRYGVAPIRNAMVNGQLSQFVKRVGSDEAPEVARFYVGLSSAWYVQKGHPVGQMLADAEKLRTEWITGRTINGTAARRQEATAANPFAALLQDGTNG